MGDGNKIAGTVLIVVGLVMLLGQLGLPGIGIAWPFFLMIPGAAFLVRYWQTKGDSGLVFTGVLLFLIGMFFQFVEWNWISIGRHWPFFVLAPGLSFLALARVDANRRDAVVPGWILVGVALVLYLFSSGVVAAILRLLLRFLELLVKVVLPLGLIGLGAWILFSRRESVGEARPFPEKIDPAGAAAGAGAAAAAAASSGASAATDGAAATEEEDSSSEPAGDSEDDEGATADVPRPLSDIEEAEFEEEEPVEDIVPERDVAESEDVEPEDDDKQSA